MVPTNKIELVNYFIFNPKFGHREGEEDKKILYYYPHETDRDVQLKNAGLCEALIKFTESFNPDGPCHSFQTEKTKQFFYQPETDFWIVVTVSVPTTGKSTDQCNEHDGNLVPENVYEAVLKKSYKMYRIFHNSFKSIMDSYSEKKLEILKEKLAYFYNNVRISGNQMQLSYREEKDLSNGIQTLPINGKITMKLKENKNYKLIHQLNYLLQLNVANCDILDVFQGIFFLPLGKEPFLHVQSFINLVETKFKPVKYSAFLYNDQLVWSGINSQDMQVIYQYLIFTLLPSHLDLELQGGSVPRGSNSSVHHYGSFVTGPSDLKDSIVSTGKVPKVYLTGDNEETEVFHLVVYRALSATICLFIPEEESLSLDLFKSLDSYLGPHLTAIVSEVSEHCVRYTSVATTTPAPGENGPKVLYFNKLNFAQKSTMHVQNRKHLSTAVPLETLRMIAELNAEKSGLNECGEVMMLTLNDCWLVGRFSNSREFYVIFSQNKGSLMEITEEVKKLCESQLKGIFFTE